MDHPTSESCRYCPRDARFHLHGQPDKTQRACRAHLAELLDNAGRRFAGGHRQVLLSVVVDVAEDLDATQKFPPIRDTVFRRPPPPAVRELTGPALLRALAEELDREDLSELAREDQADVIDKGACGLCGRSVIQTTDREWRHASASDHDVVDPFQ